MDFDGDIIFATDNKIIASGCYDFATAKPLFYTLDGSGLVGGINKQSMVEADIRGLNSKVGKISNLSGSLWGMMEDYAKESPECKNLNKSIIVLGQIVGAEIDRIKTGIKPTEPLEWTRLQSLHKNSSGKRDENGRYSADDVQKDCEPLLEHIGRIRHNKLVPDKKIYYLRYNYGTLDSDITKYDKTYNDVCMARFRLNDKKRMKLQDLIAICQNGNGTEEMEQFYQDYLRNYPVINSDCGVNHISHYFEEVEKSIEKTVKANGVDMLRHYRNDIDFDSDLMEEVTKLVKAYKNEKARIVKAYKTCEKYNHGQAVHESGETIFALKAKYHDDLIQMFCGDGDKAFNYLYKAITDKGVIWDLLENELIEMIGR